MIAIQTSLIEQAIFLFSTLTWFRMIDLLLVTVAFYFLLNLIRHSAAGYLLREIGILALVLLILTSILPLPVFDWLMRGLLVALFVTTPIIFQAQVREFINQTSRTVGIAKAVRRGAAETVVPALMHAIENMAATKTGALIALEGDDSLHAVIKSGVATGGKVTPELLQSIFYSGTPLHDGAVIICGDEISAAGCVLPLTQQPLLSDKRLGTRHRAAVGLSEKSDALVIIVSEEVGSIGVAQNGNLERPLTSPELREKLTAFYTPKSDKTATFSLWRFLWGRAKDQLLTSVTSLTPHQLLTNLGLLLISLMLALLVWSFVLQQTNAIKSDWIDDIRLQVQQVPDNVQLVPTPPSTVRVLVQTTEDVLSTLTSSSFQAVISLDQLKSNPGRVPVNVSTSTDQVMVLNSDPAELDITLVPIISRTFPIVIELPDQQNLSAAYELVGPPTPGITETTVMGPATRIEQISQVKATISLANASTSLREIRPLHAVDVQGNSVPEITLQPNQVPVQVSIRRRRNARNVSVRPIIVGPPPPGYWLSNLSVNPAGVTLQGDPDQLSQMESFVDTQKVDVTNATGNLQIQVPLDLPNNVQALDSEGNPLNAVSVQAQVTARSGDLAVTRTVKLLRQTDEFTITINPPKVDLLLSGPQPTLREIDADPDLIQVTINPPLTISGQMALTPTVTKPKNIEAQIVPPSVIVTVER